jgi:hypothetical protein
MNADGPLRHESQRNLSLLRALSREVLQMFSVSLQLSDITDTF